MRLAASLEEAHGQHDPQIPRHRAEARQKRVRLDGVRVGEEGLALHLAPIQILEQLWQQHQPGTARRRVTHEADRMRHVPFDAVCHRHLDDCNRESA